MPTKSQDNESHSIIKHSFILRLKVNSKTRKYFQRTSKNKHNYPHGSIRTYSILTIYLTSHIILSTKPTSIETNNKQRERAIS